MGKSLVLVVPEDEATKALVKDYYRRVAEVEREYGDGQSFDEYGGYNVAMEHLQDGEVPIIQEQVSESMIEGMTRQRFDAIVEKEGGNFERTVLEEEGIRELQSAFEDAVTRLNDIEPELNWEASLASNIVLCEFALDHGYAIELSS